MTRAGLSVDGGPVERRSAADLGVRLAAIEDGSVRIELTNERADGAQARRVFHLHFAVPRIDDLRAVDAAFARIVGPRTMPRRSRSLLAAGGQPHVGHALCRGTACIPARDSQKDGRLKGTGLEFAKHRDHLGRALHEMAFYPERPLARAVAGLVRFNLNALPFPEPSGIPELDSCADDLARLARGAQPALATPHVVDPDGVCPVDDVTHALLQFHRDLLDGSRRRAALTALLRIAAAAQTTPADAAKARALALGWTSELTDDERRRTAAALANDPLLQHLPIRSSNREHKRRPAEPDDGDGA